MMPPLVSILIISYNQKQYINETLNSALNQSYENIEIIVADDGSTDGTAQIILEYACKYPTKIKPLVGGSNIGITGNSNRGLNACTGKYVALLGGDDVFLPGKISSQVSWLEEKVERIICYHDIDVFDSHSNKSIYLMSEKFKPRSGLVDVVIRYGTFFGATSAMFKRIPGITFNKNIPISSDWLFWIEILYASKGEIGYIPGIYARYRRHSNNITNSSSHMLPEGLTTLAEFEKISLKNYRRTVCAKRAELFFLESVAQFKRGNNRKAVINLANSFMHSRGYWYIPPLLLWAKLIRIPV